MPDSSQKFIARNRAPRVQIEYDVELYGAEKKVQLPFVMGVMSDLLGKSKEAQPAIADRKFLEIDVDNFDGRMKGMAPRAVFSVPNTLTGEGNLSVDLTFEKMSDFSPGAIAAKVDVLRPLLDARNQLQTLMAYMDGKSGAEGLIEHILQTPALMSMLAKGEAPSVQDQALALETLRELEIAETASDDSRDVLATLAENAPPEEMDDVEDGLGDVLVDLAKAQPKAPDNEAASTQAALSTLTAVGPDNQIEIKTHEDTLASLRELEVPELEELPPSTDVLADLASIGDEVPKAEVPASDLVLDELSALELPEPAETEVVSDILQDLGAVETSSDDVADNLSDVLNTVADVLVEESGTSTATEAVFETLAEPKGGTGAQEDLSQLLDGLAALAPGDGDSEGDAPGPEDVLDALSELEQPAPDTPKMTDVLAAIPAAPSEEAVVEPESDDLTDILGGLNLDEGEDQSDSDGDLQSLLDGLAMPDAEAPSDDAGLDDLLAGLDRVASDPTAEDDIGDVLAELAMDAKPVATVSSPAVAEDTLADLLARPDLAEDSPADIADLDSLLSGLDEGTGDSKDGLDVLSCMTAPEALVEDDFDLDDLLGGLADDPEDATATTSEVTEAADDSGLDELLAGLDGGREDLKSDDDGMDALDDLLGDIDFDLADTATKGATPDQTMAFDELEFAYGTISAERPTAQQLTRRRFRIAVFGDFSGRAANGQMETGDALAARPAILLDPDTLDDVIAGFASELVLPLGIEGSGQQSASIAVKLSALDDLHPDELFENVALFSELVSLRKQLQSGVTVEHASRSLATWAAQNGTPVRVPRRQSSGNAVPADRRLSDFQHLIGDQQNTLREASPIEELLARVVGPHIHALPTPDVTAMQVAVDAALSDAMRLVLHHPEFQSLEAQWRSLDLIARSVEVDDNLEVVLYDVSAEELAADLAAQDDLAQCGLTRLLSEAPMDPETGRGGYSALIGLYAFEETPPHAELLGRIARVAAHVDAPFFTSLTPEFLKTDKKDRPSLVAKAWDTLQAMAEAGHLSLASPRFLLRRLYGAKSDPVDVFDFTEFSEQEGLKGMLWGNPVVLVAILLARSFTTNGASLQLGSIMSLGDMPFHTVIDQFGDQIALPCTERNIDLDKIALANARGVMAVSAVKGRDELRLTSFSSVAGGEVLGPWTGVPAPKASPADPRDRDGVAVPKSNTAPSDASESELEARDLELDDLVLGELDGLAGTADPDGLSDLDDLLAGFGEETDAAGDGGEMDAELAALLADL